LTENVNSGFTWGRFWSTLAAIHVETSARSPAHKITSLPIAICFLSSNPPYVPVPARLTFCGLPPPLSFTFTDADLPPLATGVNVTLMKQLAPAATLVPQVFVWAKSLALFPVIEMLVTLTAELLLLLRVIFVARLFVPTG
jgi:hypothetical protein